MIEPQDKAITLSSNQFFAWLEKTLSGLGYDLVDMEYSGRGTLLRIFIDKEEGITVDDCAEVSLHLSHTLSTINIDYKRLEVSSPGLDRVLRKPLDFERYKGRLVSVKLKQIVNGRRQLQGVLSSHDKHHLYLEADGQPWTLVLDNVQQARLVPIFE